MGIAVACSGCATGLTASPTSVSRTAAELAGDVVSNSGGQVEYWVEFGPTKSYGSETTDKTVNAAAYQVVHVEVSLTSLLPETDYHYRLCASDSQQQGGPGCSEDRRLTTQTVDCGSLVTSSVKLTGNLLCPQTAGLIVAAHGVEINLGGYTLDGGINVGGGGPRGIDNANGYDDLTVRNGSVFGWGYPIYVVGGDRNRVINVHASAAGDGVTFQGGRLNEIRNSTVNGRSTGISVVSSDGVLITNTGADGAFGSAISVKGNLAQITSNRIARAGGPLTGAPALALVGSSGRISRNHVEGPWLGGGITVSGSHDVIADNEVFGAVLSGFPDPQASWGDGIFVSAFAAGTRLMRNYVHDNEGDGIEAQDAASSIGSNVADNNGDFGIDAAAGVTDLGGNSADGNGNLAQCRNIHC